MANPYHDSEGRFASHNELKKLVQDAYDRGDTSAYIRERANLEAIEKEMEQEKANDFSAGAAFSQSQPKPKRSMKAFERADNVMNSLSASANIDTGALSSWDMEDANPYSLYPGVDLESPYKFDDNTLDAYVARSSEDGLSALSSTIELKSVMNDTQSYWPYDKPVERAGFERGEEPRFNISDSSLVFARKEASESYSNTMNIYRSRLQSTDDVHEEARIMRKEIVSSREASLEQVKKARFELAYIGDQFDYGDDWSYAEDKITKQMSIIQTESDAVVYSHAAERAIDRFIESA